MPDCVIIISNRFHGRGLVLNKQLLKHLLGCTYFCSDPTKVSKRSYSWYFKNRGLLYQLPRERTAVLMLHSVTVFELLAILDGSALLNAALK